MTDPIQEQLIAARKNQILDAATGVFAEKGFHPTTIKAIAKKAGISDGTIYNYFENKPALLLGIFDRMRVIIQEDIPTPPADADFRTFLRAVLYYPLTALEKDNFALFRIIISEMMVNEKFRALYYEQILEPTISLAETHFQGQIAKYEVSPADINLIIRVMSSMVLGLMMEHIMGDDVLRARWDELPDFLTDMFLNKLTGDQV